MEPIRTEFTTYGTRQYIYICENCGKEIVRYHKRGNGTKLCIDCTKARDKATAARKSEEKIRRYKMSGAKEFMARFLKYEASHGLCEPHYKEICDDILFEQYSDYSFKPELTVEEYSMKAHSAILYNLVDVMSDLNSVELAEHEKLDEWLAHWKNEVLSRIWDGLQEAKK